MKIRRCEARSKRAKMPDAKQAKRKVTVESSKDSRRPSVFERLGTKPSGSSSMSSENFCRPWAQTGNCPYGKSCKYANTHTSMSSSKRSFGKKDDVKQQKQSHSSHSSKTSSKEDLNKRLHSTVVKKTRSPDLNWENWDQTALEYEDEKALEKRRQLLQRELELQMKREKEEQRQRKDKKSKKGMSSGSSTSASSSSSTESSSSSDESTSSSSTASSGSRAKKNKSRKGRRDSSSSGSDVDRSKRKPVRSGKIPRSESSGLAPKKAGYDTSRTASVKRSRESSLVRKKLPPVSAKPVVKKRSLSPARVPSSHRRHSPSPARSKAKVAIPLKPLVKPTGVKHGTPTHSNRSLSLERKDKSNRSISPRSLARDRERDKDREREKEREKEKERDYNRDKDRERVRSRSPKVKVKEHPPHSPRRDLRDTRPPKDIRKKESPEPAITRDKNSRVSSPRQRSALPPRVRDNSLEKRGSNKNSPNISRDRETDRRDPSRDGGRDSWNKSGEATRKEFDRHRDKDDLHKKEELPDRRSDNHERKLLKNNESNRDRNFRETNADRGGVPIAGRSSGSARDNVQTRRMLPNNKEHRPDMERERERERDKEREHSRPQRENIRDQRDNKGIRDNRMIRDGRQVGKDKEREENIDRSRERQRDHDREKESKMRQEYERERELPSLLSLPTQNPALLHGKDKNLERERAMGRGERDRGRSERPVRGMERDQERVSDRVLDRNHERGLNRGPDRSLERGFDRTHNRGMERSFERGRGRGIDRNIERGGFDRDMDRNIGRGRSLDRGLDRDLDRPIDRSVDRMNNRSFERNMDRNFERGPERGMERAPHFDRERDRERERDRDRDRESHSERDFHMLPRNRESDRRRPHPDDKSFDGGFEGRRGREERDRYSDHMDHLRYEDQGLSPHDDQLGSMDHHMEPHRFSSERRSRRDIHEDIDHPRGREMWEGRDHEPRERERDPDRRRGYDREDSRPPGRDWDSHEYPDSRHDWDGRSRRGPPSDWDDSHHGDWGEKETLLSTHSLEDDWNGYPGDWPQSGEHRSSWNDEWPERRRGRGPSSHLGHSRDIDNLPVDESLGELNDEAAEKEVLDTSEHKMGNKIEEPVTKKVDITKKVDTPESTSKRQRDTPDTIGLQPDSKKVCVEEPFQEQLSDISDDDADEILNRDDGVDELEATESSDTAAAVPRKEDTVPDKIIHEAAVPYASANTSQNESSVAPNSCEPDQTVDMEEKATPTISRASSKEILMDSSFPLDERDDEKIGGLGFEEISDEELEEENKAVSVGAIGDALGVDWASLVAETRPKPKAETEPCSARRRWEGPMVLARLGVSVRYAGQEKAEEIMAKINEAQGNSEPATILHPVACINLSLQERREKRKALFNSFGPYKRALSARKDLAIRRQLCNLPSKEVSTENQTGDSELYKLACELFSKSG